MTAATAFHYIDETWKLVCCFLASFFFLRYRQWKKTAMLLKAQRDHAMDVTEAALSFDYPRLDKLLKMRPGSPKPPRGDA